MRRREKRDILVFSTPLPKPQTSPRGAGRRALRWRCRWSHLGEVAAPRFFACPQLLFLCASPCPPWPGGPGAHGQQPEPIWGPASPWLRAGPQTREQTGPSGPASLSGAHLSAVRRRGASWEGTHRLYLIARLALEGGVSCPSPRPGVSRTSSTCN